MADQPPQQQLKTPPDLSKLPNFQGALDWVKEKERAGHTFAPIKKWMELLEDWCREAIDKLQTYETEEADEISKLKTELEDSEIDAASYREVREKLEDVTRGVADIEEVYDLCGVHFMTARS